MNIFEFGDAKLRAKDIDPLYRALVAQGQSKIWLARFTLAFVSFDHAGVACKVVDAGNTDFWPAMRDAAGEKLRGAPRRYFFPKLAVPTITGLQARYGSAKAALDSLEGSYAHAMGVVCGWPYYGPTAAFKMADMAERVCGVKVDFSDCTPEYLMSNKMVIKGVEKACVEEGYITPGDLFKYMKSYKWATKAPPHCDRPLNMQEFETILCYYSHDDGKNRHLPGMDIENIIGELKGWGPTAEKLIKCLS